MGPVLQLPEDWGVGVAAAKTMKKRMTEMMVWVAWVNIVKEMIVSRDSK